MVVVAVNQCGQDAAVLSGVLERECGLGRDRRGASATSTTSGAAAGRRLSAASGWQALPVDVLRRRAATAGERGRWRHEKDACHEGAHQQSFQPCEHGRYCSEAWSGSA